MCGWLIRAQVVFPNCITGDPQESRGVRWSNKRTAVPVESVHWPDGDESCPAWRMHVAATWAVHAAVAKHALTPEPESTAAFRQNTLYSRQAIAESSMQIRRSVAVHSDRVENGIRRLRSGNGKIANLPHRCAVI